MKAGECLLSLASAIRGGITFASQAQHPILQQHAKLCSNHTSSVPQLQSLASLATLCRPRDEQPSTMYVAHSLQQPSCMPQRTQQQTIRCHQSGSQTAAAPSLKQRLRELMMLVHPDRWSAHPKARQENERSFKLLNEYLEAAKAVSVLIVMTNNVLLDKSSCPQLSPVPQIDSRLEPLSPTLQSRVHLVSCICAHVLYLQHVCSTNIFGDAGRHCSTGGRSSIPLCVLLAPTATRGALRRRGEWHRR